ncbi:MAG: hypothetical protein WA012_07640, partial [Rhodoferax sp.]|uniref:hypothetical protein n=1 Tax=Rhodoferax sp. TaxID=50421 RepID=UPI003BAF68AE
PKTPSICSPSESAEPTMNGEAIGQLITAMPLESASHHFESHPFLVCHSGFDGPGYPAKWLQNTAWQAACLSAPIMLLLSLL